VSLEETVMVKKMFVAAQLAILLLTTAALAHAQGGCVDSPEDPTVVSGLIAAAAAFGLMRFGKRSDSRDK
jgi:XrtJ-associated TM-motif-TM protein